MSLDNPKVLPMAPTGSAAININVPNIPVGEFGKNLLSLSYKIRSTLRNWLSHLKFIIVDEISMVSNNLLYYIHLRRNEIFVTADTEPFAGLIILAVGDFFQLSPVGGLPGTKSPGRI